MVIGLICYSEWIGTVTAIGTLAAVFVALIATFYPTFREWRKRPRLRIKFLNQEPYCRTVSEVVREHKRYYIRLKIENYGKSLAKACKGKLIAIANKDLTEISTDFDPVILRWAGNIATRHRIGDSHSMEYSWKPELSINTGEYEYLDLISIRLDKSIIRVETLESIPRGIKLEFELDCYFFLVTIHSESAAATSKLLKLVVVRELPMMYEANKDEFKAFHALMK